MARIELILGDTKKLREIESMKEQVHNLNIQNHKYLMNLYEKEAKTAELERRTTIAKQEAVHTLDLHRYGNL